MGKRHFRKVVQNKIVPFLGHTGRTGPRTLLRHSTLWGSRTLWRPRTLWGPTTLWGLRILWWSRKDPGTYKLTKGSWFSHHVFNLVKLTVKGRFIYHCWMQINLKYTNVDLKISLYVCVHIKTIACKTKNMLEIKREQLWVLTILVHEKTGPIIVTCSR